MKIFYKRFIQSAIQRYQFSLVIYDVLQQEIVKWL